MENAEVVTRRSLGRILRYVVFKRPIHMLYVTQILYPDSISLYMDVFTINTVIRIKKYQRMSREKKHEYGITIYMW